MLGLFRMIPSSHLLTTLAVSPTPMSSSKYLILWSSPIFLIWTAPLYRFQPWTDHDPSDLDNVQLLPTTIMHFLLFRLSTIWTRACGRPYWEYTRLSMINSGFRRTMTTTTNLVSYWAEASYPLELVHRPPIGSTLASGRFLGTHSSK